MTWLKLASYLRRTLPRFRACTVVSERERELVRAAAPGYANVRVIPNALDLGHYAHEFGAPHPNTLLFSGSLTYRANLDAARHFLGEIYPLIRRAAPGITLKITGSTDGVDLSSLPAHPGIDLTGHVPDIRPVITRSWVSVVPLRMGGGTRLKILESMALGTPVVSTRKGAEGLDVTDGRNILLADTPAEFATRVVDVLRSPSMRESLASEGRMLVRERYDWRVVGEELNRLVEYAA